MQETAALRQISILHVFRPGKLYETMVTPICQLQDGTSKIINLKLHEHIFCCIKHLNYKIDKQYIQKHILKTSPFIFHTPVYTVKSNTIE